ncbi:hypothetical protein HDU76_004650 [Blyttiomyces sp. JEL0837]|nr:hypothetical protein HDU76_004650 [Blyttiomyces sp. JEL0837]
MTDAAATTRLVHLCDTNAPLTRLEVKKHFDSLTDMEKLYVHWIAKSSWAAARIISATTSHQAADLVDMLLDLFTQDSSEPKKTIRDVSAWKTASGLSDESWKLFLEYAVQVLYNLSNFKSFGDTKFIPNLPIEEFTKAVETSDRSKAQGLYENLKSHIYALEPASENFLGYNHEGHVTGYYGADITKEEIDFVQAFLESKNFSALNTRIFKTDAGVYQVKVAASRRKDTVTHDHEAQFCTDDQNKRNMILKYAESFEKGDMEAHKESQRLWIKDVGPTVECNLGFIETYKDPHGVRAEWEGFVAVVNKEQTAKFEKLVNGAENYIKSLPWDAAFEKDKFNRPDFTSLEVVSFATAGSPPLGINIPNYDDVRMKDGFKNVSLGNVANAKAPGEVVTFIHPDDLPMFEKYRGEAFEVQVGLHELLGHGTGKLLQEEPAGTFNFDKENPPKNPLTGEPVTTWYKPGQTWGSQFGSISNTFEECRAETVAMSLIVNKEILSVFNIKDEECMDIIHTSYLQMARAGLVALEVYDPKAKKWGQAHMQARYGILQVFLKAGIATITLNEAGDDLTVRIDREKIIPVGLPAINEFLLKLQVYKSTADVKNGAKFYNEITAVPEEPYVKYRDIVIRRKQPRKVFVQGNTRIERGTAVLYEYPLTSEGFIQSVIERGF